MDVSDGHLAGCYAPQKLKQMLYGSNVVEQKLVSCLSGPSSRAFIVTGNSLATKTPLIRKVEDILTPPRHAGTFSGIQQHSPHGPLQEALARVQKDPTIDTLISVGGGSPIDAAKSIIYHIGTDSGRWLSHIAVPTTLSAAECTDIGGTTMSDGLKKGIRHPDVYPAYILYDATFALHTPPHLLLTTAIRALDHAVEVQYHPSATWIPCQVMALNAVANFFLLLPKYKENPKDEDTITRLFLCAYASLGSLGQNFKGSVGLSHTIGYSLGSPYGIPHGVTSCMTLARVVKLKSSMNSEGARRIAGILPFIGGFPSGDHRKDGEEVGTRIGLLISDLGLATTLTEWKVNKDQIDVICERATGAWMPGEEKLARRNEFVLAVRALIEDLY
ncbi:uncharacterized protein A1O5_13366 [Cladophialophora psammophila CBS 110553]|uniref:Uncharacterized protein n=1 Tax=Cladophialophora psammophila CBS 110553 TaxID=1182543 RepID=W9VCR3_9EURO|nr:uncharacterized protein A1O5_13366 [Cladophialophora psammophila CBS 110553]EXJ53377.1 hypothetical protein A1O5_13366 [Cladophialophora psammophila CBS 110553]